MLQVLRHMRSNANAQHTQQPGLLTAAVLPRSTEPSADHSGASAGATLLPTDRPTYAPGDGSVIRGLQLSAVSHRANHELVEGPVTPPEPPPSTRAA